MRVVMKFGGTSVGSGERMRSVASIATQVRDKGNDVVIVVSAMSGVTDSLVKIARQAGVGDSKGISSFMHEIATLHAEGAMQAIKEKSVFVETSRKLEEVRSELERALVGISCIAELTPRSNDYIISFGERFSAWVVAGALKSLGVKSEALMGGEAGIVTDDEFGEARPLMNVTTHRAKKRILPMFKAGVIPVVSGFTGVTQEGVTTTLGRGGSDYTASILGVALDADEVWVWKDVDGIMSADPTLVSNARLMSEVSFAEAIEMAHFGAEIIHPRALELAAEHKLPMRVKNTFAPEKPGTIITLEKKVKPGDIVKAIGLVEDLGLVTVSGSRLVGSPQITAKVLQILGEEGIDILMISQSSSEANVTLALPKEDLERAVNKLELGLLGSKIAREITTDSDLSLIACVGAGMRGTPGVAARVFTAIAKAGINVRAIAQGSSELNISFIVRKEDGRKAVAVLHEAFLGT